MADSDFSWVGPVMGTMVVGGVLVGMSNNLFGQNQQATVKKRKPIDIYSRSGKLSKKSIWESAGYKPLNTPW